MASQIYVNQTQVRLKLQTDVDFNSYPVSSCEIRYKKPDGTVGHWDAAALSGSEEFGIIYCDFSDSVKFDQAGVWKIWAYVVFSSTKIGIGITMEYYVKTEGARR